MLSPSSDVANITLAHCDAVGRGHPLHHFSAEINTALALAATSATAFAADPIMPAPTPSIPVVDSSSIWDGFYAGLSAGYAWGEGEATVLGVTDEEDLDGWLGGAQVGYNFSSGSFVFGIEADIQAANIVYDEDLGGGWTGQTGIGAFGTVRGRIGADLDGFMPYVTAGLAYGQYFYELEGPGGASFTDDQWNVGWTAGAGVEAMVAENISVKAEYLYLDLQDDTFDILGTDVDVDTYAHSARVGFNFHF